MFPILLVLSLQAKPNSSSFFLTLFLQLLPLAPPRGLLAGAAGQLSCGADNRERALLGPSPRCSGVTSRPRPSPRVLQLQAPVWMSLHGPQSPFWEQREFRWPRRGESLLKFWGYTRKAKDCCSFLHTNSPDAIYKFLKELTGRTERERSFPWRWSKGIFVEDTSQAMGSLWIPCLKFMRRELDRRWNAL